MKHVGRQCGGGSDLHGCLHRACAAVWSSSPPTIRRCTPPRTSRTTATTPARPRSRCWSRRDSAETKAYTKLAFELSERFDTPVFLRTTTRISHATGPVPLGEVEPSAVPLGFVEEPAKWVMLPVNARKRHVVVEERMRALREFAETLRRQPDRVGRPVPGHHHGRGGVPVRPGGVPARLGSEAGDGPPPARASHPRVCRGGDAAGGGGGAGPDHRDPCEGDGDPGRREGPGADPGGAQPADRPAGDQRRSGAAARTRERCPAARRISARAARTGASSSRSTSAR